MTVGGLVLKNRLTTAPTYLDCAGEGGNISLMGRFLRVMREDEIPAACLERNTFYYFKNLYVIANLRLGAYLHPDDFQEGLNEVIAPRS
jgi:hypothetical protein